MTVILACTLRQPNSTPSPTTPSIAREQLDPIVGSACTGLHRACLRPHLRPGGLTPSRRSADGWLNVHADLTSSVIGKAPLLPRSRRTVTELARTAGAAPQRELSRMAASPVPSCIKAEEMVDYVAGGSSPLR